MLEGGGSGANGDLSKELGPRVPVRMPGESRSRTVSATLQQATSGLSDLPSELPVRPVWSEKDVVPVYMKTHRL